SLVAGRRFAREVGGRPGRANAAEWVPRGRGGGRTGPDVLRARSAGAVGDNVRRPARRGPRLAAVLGLPRADQPLDGRRGALLQRDSPGGGGPLPDSRGRGECV